MHPKKRTVGVRIPDHVVVPGAARRARRADAVQHPDPAGRDEPLTLGWEIKEELDHVVDVVVDAGETPAEPTTVVDWSDAAPVVVRAGAGDPSRFE